MIPLYEHRGDLGTHCSHSDKSLGLFIYLTGWKSYQSHFLYKATNNDCFINLLPLCIVSLAHALTKMNGNKNLLVPLSFTWQR